MPIVSRRNPQSVEMVPERMPSADSEGLAWGVKSVAQGLIGQKWFEDSPWQGERRGYCGVG